MYFLKSSILLAGLCLLSTTIEAQSLDSSIQLKSVEIKATKWSTPKLNYLNDVFTANSIQSQMSEFYIKNYGVGQLSTLSVRGFGAENVALLWENIPINSVMNGVFDLNTIPSSLMQKVSYQDDDNRYTSAGNLSLNNTSFAENKLIISSTSYLSDLYSNKIEGSWTKNNSSFSLIHHMTHGRNNFNYKDTNGTEQSINHNQISQINSQLYFSQKLEKDWKFNAGAWGVWQSKEIPTTTNYFSITQSIADQNYRFFAGIQNQKWDVKLSYHNENQQYEDANPLFPFSSMHKIQSFKGVIKYNTNITDKFSVKYLLYPSYNYVKSTNLDTTRELYDAVQQLNATYKFSNQITTDIGIKTQVNTLNHNILLPYIAATYAQEKWSVSLIGDINQRNPTVNEYFWNPVGDTSLKPETNYQIRNVWKYNTSTTNHNLLISIEPYFLHSINNIRWQPLPSFVWAPMNIAEVTNIGVNGQMEYTKRLDKDNILRTIVSTHYIHSKTKDDKNSTYIPAFKSIVSLNWINESFELLVQNNYTSERYTNANNTESLPYYYLMNIKASYKLPMDRNQVKISLGIDNVFNKDYQEIQYSVLPLRNYYLNLLFSL